MSRKTGIRCSCGHRITPREILKHGIMMADWRPIYAYVRFRCSRCRRLGEQLIDYPRWDQSVVADDGVELNPRERAKFDALAPITTDEVIEFASGLKHATVEGLMPEQTKERSLDRH